ncbi:hypothetical protein RvY_13687-2 [Ramazzottius varieornatus]|uniref:Uncharacterized protein n=1 Tax=Ramazzottius varieornatus TaxID=947166 RepID=A0A1D1VW74_RAMVA|nr:hypothetical protein RvY_13687-2 [Ramazzottius varieornatus]
MTLWILGKKKLGVPVHDSRVRLFLRSRHIFVKLYAQHHSWTVVKASQFIMNESSVELRELYGTDELPWVRLYLRKTPSTFVTSVLAASLVVLVLNGFLLMHNWKSEAHYIVCALSLIFFGGLHAWTSVIIPSSPTIPWFSLFLALASILLFSTLLTLPVLIGRRPSNLHQTSSSKVFLAFTSLLTKIFTRLDTSRYLDICGPGCGKLQVGGLVKGCAVVVYGASALLIISLTLRPFLQESYAEGST